MAFFSNGFFEIWLLRGVGKGVWGRVWEASEKGWGVVGGLGSYASRTPVFGRPLKST